MLKVSNAELFYAAALKNLTARGEQDMFIFLLVMDARISPLPTDRAKVVRKGKGKIYNAFPLTFSHDFFTRSVGSGDIRASVFVNTNRNKHILFPLAVRFLRAAGRKVHVADL